MINKYQHSNQKILISIINKKYLVYNGRKFLFIKVRSEIVGFFFSDFLYTKSFKKKLSKLYGSTNTSFGNKAKSYSE